MNFDAPAENFPPQLNMMNTPTPAGIGQAMCSRAATKNKSSQDPPTLQVLHNGRLRGYLSRSGAGRCPTVLLCRRRPSDATTPGAKADNGPSEMKATKTPVSVA